METLVEKANYLKSLKTECLDLSFLWEKYIIENATTRDNTSLSEQQQLMIIKGESASNIGSFNSMQFERFYGIFLLYDYIKYVLDEEKKGWKWFNLDDKRIKDMHRQLFDRGTEFSLMISGRYRSYAIFVDEEEKLDYQAIIKEMNSLLRYYHSSQEDIFTKLATFHIIFEDKIHPFGDGNGRTGRAIMNLELARNGYPIIGLVYPNYQRYDEVFIKNDPIQELRNFITETLETKIDEEIKILDYKKTCI